MPFAVSIIWREPTDHVTDCYFCMIPPIAKGLLNKKIWTVQYLNIPSALHPVLHNKDIPVPELQESYEIESVYGEDNEVSEPGPSTS